MPVNPANAVDPYYQQQSTIKMISIRMTRQVIIFPRLVRDLYLSLSSFKFFMASDLGEQGMVDW